MAEDSISSRLAREVAAFVHLLFLLDGMLLWWMKAVASPMTTAVRMYLQRVQASSHAVL